MTVVAKFSALRRASLARVARRVEIHSGLRIGEQVEIIQGLQEHQQVVTRGFLELTDGKQVKVVGSPAAVATPSTPATASAN